MDRITKDGAIKTNETMSPGYVWYKCSVYNLPDNTMGGVGYHVVYRPLCKPDYQGAEVVTDQMMADTREHYRLVKEMDKADEEIAEAKASKDCDEMDKIDRQRKANGLCPHCHTYCDGDCQVN